MRSILGIHLRPDLVLVAAGTATDSPTAHRYPTLSLFPNAVRWPAGSPPRLTAPNTNSGDLFRNYLDRICDPNPVHGASNRRSAAEVLGALLHLTAAATIPRSDAHLGAVAVVHPTHWTADQVRALRLVIARSGIATDLPVVLLSERDAQSRSIAWASDRRMAQILTVQPEFAAAWCAALVAATSIVQLPLPPADPAPAAASVAGPCSGAITVPFRRADALRVRGGQATSPTAPRTNSTPALGQRGRWSVAGKRG